MNILQAFWHYVSWRVYLCRYLALYDDITLQHVKRVAKVVVRLGYFMKIPKGEIVNLYLGALLHDIGKTKVAADILNKRGSLTKNEREILRQHPLTGFKMLRTSKCSDKVLEIVHYHHERWDGNGYPGNLSGKEIPQAARIIAVVDVWDALTSLRSYRAAWSLSTACAYIQQQSGKHFDPHVVKAFLELASQPIMFPAQSKVLNTPWGDSSRIISSGYMQPV